MPIAETMLLVDLSFHGPVHFWEWEASKVLPMIACSQCDGFQDRTSRGLAFLLICGRLTPGVDFIGSLVDPSVNVRQDRD